MWLYASEQNKTSYMAKFKNVVVFPGHYTTREAGDKIPGLDLAKFVRDVLYTQANIDTYYCSDSFCGDQSKLTTITELKIQIAALEARLLAAGIA